MKKILVITLALLISTLVSFAQITPTAQTTVAQTTVSVDSVFADYYEATGGKDLWNSLKTYTLKRSYRSNSSADYDAEIYVSLPEQAMNKSKIILKRNFVYAVKGTEGWLKIPLGSYDKVTKYQVKDLSQNEQDNMRLEMYDLLVPFINYKSRGLIATYVGNVKIGTNDVHHVELQGKGVKYNLYFDAKTGLLIREKETQAGEVITTDYSDYTKSKFGIVYPATLTQTNSKDKSKVNITSELVVNETINPEYFQR
jgi:hypothetical protein